jgi:hypothetical protein
MSVVLRPRPRFPWDAVSWGGPDEPPADDCSLCDAPIAEDDVPLIIWTEDAWCARFCDACQRRWWGLASSWISGGRDGP